jgi:hypothetical protein
VELALPAVPEAVGEAAVGMKCFGHVGIDGDSEVVAVPLKDLAGATRSMQQRTPEV